MRKKLMAVLLAGVMLAAIPMGASAATTGNVTINASNFPDKTFRSYVSSNFDTNGNGVLSASEIADATGIIVVDSGITSLDGIEYFTELTWLDCFGNNIRTLDLSKNRKIESLRCEYNDLYELTVAATDVFQFSCEYNHLVKLDLSSLEESVVFLSLSPQTRDVTATQEGDTLKISLSDLVGAKNVSNISLKKQSGVSIVGDDIVITDPSIRKVTYNYDTGCSAWYDDSTDMEVTLTITKVNAADTSRNGLLKASNGNWYYYKDGVVQTDYSGFASNSKGKWYIEKGKVTFSKNDVIKDTKGAIGTKNTWYYVVGSKVQTGYTGVANYKNSNGWWYIKKGKVDFNTTGVYKNNKGWWYVKKGRVDFTHNGVDKNSNGWWYVTGGKVQFGYTGLANYKNSNGWWYIKNGKVDFTHNGVDKNKNGWYYVDGGRVQFTYTGVSNYKNKNGWWYIKKGRVDFSYTGRAKNKYGTWNVVNGKVRF